MSGQVAGKIWASDPEALTPPPRVPISIRTQVRVLNSDIDVAELKSEHTMFLNEKVLPALKMNAGLAISLTGHAGRSGERNLNNALSTYKRHLTARCCSASCSSTRLCGVHDGVVSSGAKSLKSEALPDSREAGP